MYIDNHQFHTLIHNRSKCTNVQIPHIVIIVTSLNENKNIYKLWNVASSLMNSLQIYNCIYIDHLREK